jgi:protein arginine N-methyltransferase 2
MAAQPTVDSDSEVLSQINEVLRAASEHDLEALDKAIDQYRFPDCKVVDVQDPATGYSPLHAAVHGARRKDPNKTRPGPEYTAAVMIDHLLQNGAIWNQLDKDDETPGCLAFRLGLTDLYSMMVAAGARAEMLLSRLEEYDLLDGEDYDEDEEEGKEMGDATTPETLDDTEDANLPEQEEDVGSTTYLSSTLSLGAGKLLDEQQNGVMMAWESGIMKRSADALLSPRRLPLGQHQQPRLRILNVGFGMGIIDTHIQNHASDLAGHHIVEAHPDVLREMHRTGWMDKDGVVVHAGKWQDVLPQLAAEGEMFDAIYFDTFAESYSQFRGFFSEHVIALLNPDGGRWSFFNGMGADRQISYDVYQQVAKTDLFECGFNVEWEDVELPPLGDREWEGVRRRYWNVDKYRLAICTFLDS